MSASNTDLVVVDKRIQYDDSPAVSPAPNPMSMLQMAVSQNCDIEKLTKLMDLQERWEKNEARRAFDKAFAAFKSESIQIIKNIEVTAGPLAGKKYADLYAVVNSTTPAMSRHGLSASWRLTKDEPSWMEVTCILRHELGHSESAAMGGPPDKGGAKNAIQERASTKSYLERYTFLAVTGLAASGEDTDGNMTVQGLSKIESAPTMEALQAEYTAAFKAAAGNQRAQKAIIASKDARKKQLAAPVINAEQVKRFVTIVSKANATDDDRHRVLKHFGYASSKDIRTSDYEKLCSCFESGEWAEL